MKKLSLITIFILLLACGRGGEDKKAPPPAESTVIKDGRLYTRGFEEREPENGGVFRRSLPSEPVTLNPVVAADMTSYLAYKWIFDPLLDMDKDMKLTGVLAESWEMSPDGLTLTFNLRKNAKWHDGRPFTSDDVIFTLDAIRDRSVEAINKRASLERVASYSKLDDFTVEIKFREKYAPSIFDFVLYIVPKHVYGYPKGEGKKFNSHERNASPVGSGPFRFVSWKRGESIELSANPDYFRGRPRVDSLVLRIMPLLETEHSAFLTDTLDLTRLSPEMWEKTSADPAFKQKAHLLEYPSRNYFYIGWNQDGSNPFFADRIVRKAMTLAINREAFISKILKGHALPCTGPFFPGSGDSDPSVSPLPCDPAEASRLLDEAGWKDTNGNGIRDKAGVEFEFECIYAQEARDYQRFLEFFQQDLKKAGVSMKLRPVEWSVFLKRTHTHKFDAFLSGYSFGDDPNPYSMYHSSMAELLPSGEGKGENDVSYVNPDLDRLLDEQLLETDPGKRQKILWKIHGIIHEDQPYTFLVVPKSLAAVNNRFQGVDLSEKGYGLFTFYPALLDWWVPKEKRSR
ncbi:MAG TPA: peptide-binding protein [Acidobacteriota bacterium]|nr:peptide-binding protein [Acidobacteriota bacterium]HNT17292.1 peptide-binding protein [Acidobacteriota bacterium]HPA26355.1 peptide-binding protein [Acidobacteriota bacterium]HQO19749.1 peptide-binding protein [Acidobacteriota bacterium]HQQ46337.1 peptide-binding protein [Acidobacteriota bacterium]